ncbi:MAG TPA: transcriptional regulator [Steroidobacteraceae bacterium]|jgi:DNA-binding MarR family transcriptional regulator|nr:transcriptional regulator [Steroidobacteraceae bacterium]
MSKAKSKGQRAHPFAYEGLDRVMHERARLGVLTSLLGNAKGLSFAALRQLCGLTDGNLSRHLEVLETAKLIEITRTLDDARPQSLIRITASGRKRFLSYLAVLEQVLLDAGAPAEGDDARARGLLHPQGR